MKTLPLYSLLALALIAFAACSKKPAEHDHVPAASPTQSHSHAHAAPHGGTLVELGDHHLILEFVHDPAAGKLTAYVLDAHAENFVRSPLAAIHVSIDRAGTPTPLSLYAVTNAATGETVGNSAEFTAEADWLKSASPLNLTIPALMIGDRTFSNVSATVQPPAQP